MLNINFLPESNREDLSTQYIQDVAEYKEIWNKYGESIVKSIEQYSELTFRESEINAIIFTSNIPSRSVPLLFKAGLSKTTKKGIVVHELCHRILSGNHIKVKTNDKEKKLLETHKGLNLILYDIWVDVYDKEFSDRMVSWESGLKRDAYKKAWVWALSFENDDRRKQFQIYKDKNG